jgi:site-specific DNA recombinase
MWMGGLPPLGYDVQNRKLVVNEEEARSVRYIFERYRQLGSLRALQAELDAAGIASKRRTLADGSPYGDRKLSRGALYLMLQNRIYRGFVTHKGNAYPGEHSAIIDEPLWNEVQDALSRNRVDRTNGSNARNPSLLAGIVFDEAGDRLTPSHAIKKGTRYRYYVSRSLIVGPANDRPRGRRIPAAELEGIVLARVRSFLADAGAILDAIRDQHTEGAQQYRLIERARQIARELTTQAPDQTRALLTTLISRVDIRADRVEITIRCDGLVELLSTPSTGSIAPAEGSDEGSSRILTLTVDARLRRVGREMKMLVENADDRTAPDPGLVRIIARAHDVHTRLMQDTDLTVLLVARQESVSAGYISRLLRLPSLAPDIVTAIMNGRNPPQLTAKKLMRLALQIPIDWSKQRKLLGFESND